METTNPAARLHQLLVKAKSVGSGAAVDLWAKVFEITESDLDKKQVEVISRLLQLRKLIEETYEGLQSIDGLPERYFRPFERIRAIPKQSFASLNTDISAYINGVTEGDMTVLEFCSEKLDSLHKETVVDETDLQSVLVNVTTLFDEVKIGDLDSDLKTFILDGLESIRRGIYEFRIRGPRRLKEAIAEILANAMMNQEVVREAEEEESLKKFNEAFNRFAALVAFASNSMSLLTAFTGPLLPGSPTP